MNNQPPTWYATETPVGLAHLCLTDAQAARLAANGHTLTQIDNPPALHSRLAQLLAGLARAAAPAGTAEASPRAAILPMTSTVPAGASAAPVVSSLTPGRVGEPALAMEGAR